MFLYVLLVIEGYIGLAIQMLMLRQLTPEVGSSALTSSWVIGFFLLSLAVGYKKGGKQIESPLNKLSDNLINVGLWSGLGLSSLFTMAFFEISSFMPTMLALIFYCVIVVIPIAFWMGQSLPLLIQESKWGNVNSEISGNALYLSTIGSFLGAILTTSVFLLFIGSTVTLFFVSFLSIATGIFIKKKINVMPVIFIVISGLANLGFSNMTGMIGTPYADVYVVENGKDGESIFIANKTAMSIIKDGKNDAWYLRQFNDFVIENKIENDNLLILGAGGFVAHLNDNKNNYTYVDIDKDLKAISEELFLKEKINHEFVSSDARRYLIDNKIKRNVIFLDAFSSQRSIPAHLVTKEFFLLIRDRLNIDGVLIVNSILDPKFENKYSMAFHSTLMSVFPFCTYKTNAVEDSVLANFVYFCEKKSEKITIYSDEKNNNEIDYWN